MANHKFHILGIPNPCKAMFASVHIPEGTVILEESPFLLSARSRNSALQAWNSLTPPSKDMFNDHFGNDPINVSQDQVYRTLVTNAFPAETRDWSRSHGIFINASRIRRSCEPNARFEWNKYTKTATMRAIKDIPKHGEITVLYIP